jgi:hypothetical protein
MASIDLSLQSLPGREELAVLESSDGLEEDELDVLKSLLVYILIRKSSFEKEDIYSMVFGGGRRILWN